MRFTPILYFRGPASEALGFYEACGLGTIKLIRRYEGTPGAGPTGSASSRRGQQRRQSPDGRARGAGRRCRLTAARADHQRHAEGQHRERGGEFEGSARPARRANPRRPRSAPRSTWRTPPSRRARPVVTAVPSAIAKVAATPAAKSPCASANTSTRIAPEQGRTPAAITVPTAARQENAPSSSAGSGAWTWPHSSGPDAAPPGGAARNPGDGRVSAGRAPGDARVGRSGRHRPATFEMAPQRRGERAALPPDEPEANGGDAAIAQKLEPVGRAVHFRGGRVEDEAGRADQHDRDRRLQQRREQRQSRAPFQRAFVGEHVGGDHRLAVARSRGVKDAIGEAERDQAPGCARVAVKRMDLGRHQMGEARLFGEKPAGDAALGAPAALAAADRERPGRGLSHRRRGRSEPDGGCGQEGRICPRLRHGQAMMALLAILNPKLDPGERLVKKDSSSFFLSPSSRGFGFATEAEQPAGAETSVTGSLSSNSKSMKNSGSATRKRHELGERSRGLERQRDVELDQMVGPLLHPVIGHRAEFSRLSADLQRGEIADLGEALGVFLGERRELARA